MFTRVQFTFSNQLIRALRLDAMVLAEDGLIFVRLWPQSSGTYTVNVSTNKICHNLIDGYLSHMMYLRPEQQLAKLTWKTTRVWGVERHLHG